MADNIPLVGIGVIVLRGSRILLGKRKGSHGAGTWALPGGHLEFGEDVEECAVREVMEETGLFIRPISRGPYTSDVFEDEGKHYVTLFVSAWSGAGEAQLLEPQKCSEWRWFPWSKPPHPLFPPLVSLYQSGFVPPLDGCLKNL